MSKNGYQQFFKKAQDIKRGEPANDHRSSTKDRSEQRLRQAFKMSSRKKRPPLPLKPVIGMGVSLVLGLTYIIFPDTFEYLAERIEVNAVGRAAAEDKAAEHKAAAEKSAGGKAATEKTAATATKEGKVKGPEEKEAGAEDLSHFEKLKQRKEELDRREKELSELEEELQRQKVELDKRILQLEETRNQIAQILKDRVEVDQEKVNKLVELYSNMKPKQAADVIGSINEDLAVEILAKMKKKNAAEVMNLLPPEKARVLSEKYTGYRRNHASVNPDPKG